jgi:hypothetical protein
MVLFYPLVSPIGVKRYRIADVFSKSPYGHSPAFYAGHRVFGNDLPRGRFQQHSFDRAQKGIDIGVLVSRLALFADKRLNSFGGDFIQGHILEVRQDPVM